MTRFERITILFAFLALIPPAIAFYVDYIYRQDYRSWVNVSEVDGGFLGISDCCVYFELVYEFVNTHSRSFNFNVESIPNRKYPSITYDVNEIRKIINIAPHSRREFSYFFYIDLEPSFALHVKDVWSSGHKNETENWNGIQLLVKGRDESLNILNTVTKGNYFMRREDGMGEGVEWVDGKEDCSILEHLAFIEDAIGACIELVFTADEGFELKTNSVWVGAFRWAFESTPGSAGIDWAPRYWRKQ